MLGLNFINWNQLEDPMDLDVWSRLTANFWLDTKIPVSNDLPSWNKMTRQEQEVVKKTFAVLTTLDTLQSEYGAEALTQFATTQHEKAVYSNIHFMESVHAKSYSTIFSTLCSSEEIEELVHWAGNDVGLQAVVAAIGSCYQSDNRDQVYSASVLLESMLFYTGFYTPLRLAAEGKLTNTADIIRLILRDEGVHGFYIGYKFQRDLVDEESKNKARQMCEVLVESELVRIQSLYGEIGWVKDVSNFLRYNANKALANLGIEPLYTKQEEVEVPAYILAALDPGTGETHDFFSGSGASYVVGKSEDTTEEDWDF